MDLASGYSDSINYGNGYTPLANQAINNNNADYWRNQAATALMAQNAQNNVFASGGGFGQQTADYAGAGAAYGRATGGFNGATPNYGGNDYFNWEMQQQKNKEQPTNFDDRFSAAPAITPGLQPQGGDYSMFPNAISAGVDPSRNVNVGNSSFNSRFGAFPDPATPMYTPQDFPGWNAPTPNYGGNAYFNMEMQQQHQLDQLARQMSGGGDSFNDRWGNLPGQPYGQGYFDNTFGSVANTGGTSQQPYQGNPFYMPQPMPAQQPVWGGGGFGAAGFGPYGGGSYTGQPGYGLGVGQIGASGAGVQGVNPAWAGQQGSPGMSPGYGGLMDNPTPQKAYEPWLNAS